MTSSRKYPALLDTVQFKHWEIKKKSGKVRHVYEYEPASYEEYTEYNLYAKRIRAATERKIPWSVKTRCAYHKKVSIPMLLKRHESGKVFVQLDIVDFFNSIPLQAYDAIIPDNYYYDVINKIGIKQGLSIAGDITNYAMLSFDLECHRKWNGYTRYADDIMISVDSMEEALEAMQFVYDKISSMGMEVNKRKTVITDLSKPGDAYVKYLGYTIKRDKLDTQKLRITISRKKRSKYWARGQHAHMKGVVCGRKISTL